MFYRRIYYDKLTGEILDSRMGRGEIRILPQEEEFARYPSLAGYNAATAGVLEWLEPDAEVEAQFEAQHLDHIDVSKTPVEMVFVPFAPPEPDELMQALNLLGVQTETEAADETN